MAGHICNSSSPEVEEGQEFKMSFSPAWANKQTDKVYEDIKQLETWFSA